MLNSTTSSLSHSPPSELLKKSGHCRQHSDTQLLDSLLDDIYSHHNVGGSCGSGCESTGGGNQTTESEPVFDAPSLSNTRRYYSEYFGQRRQSCNSLGGKSLEELREIRSSLSSDVNQISSKLVRLLKQRDITNRKVEQLANILTAVLQATSAKTAADAKLSFSLAASPGESGWHKWTDAMRAISRLPGGIPDQFRRKLWVGLADNYLAQNRIDWDSVARTAFNDKSNPDDSALGLQIVKDLHRTGCSNAFLPADADVEAERILLKRVLLAFARYNKQVGYCQGFNVLATVILDTVDRNEYDALKVMIYLIDHVLPANYYSNCLRLLAVDLAVFRHLLAANLPQLAQHLDKLQKKATTADDGIAYEPPLTNVFLMQWLLTLYATCLPKHALLRFWDCLLLTGSDALLSAGLHIFTKLSKQILACHSTTEYYQIMEKAVKAGILREPKQGVCTEADTFIQSVYKQLTPSVGELREQLLYSIQPFMAPAGLNSQSNTAGAADQQKASFLGCFSGSSIICGRSMQHVESNGAIAQQSTFNRENEQLLTGLTDEQLRDIGAVRERMTTDLKKLRKNYDRLAKNRSNAVVVVPAALDSAEKADVEIAWNMSALHQKLGRSQSVSSHSYKTTSQVPNQPCFMTNSCGVMNHLLVSKQGLEEVNQKIIAAPILEMILPPTPSGSQASSGRATPRPRKFSLFSQPTTSTAQKYPTDPPDRQLNSNESGFGSMLTPTSPIQDSSIKEFQRPARLIENSTSELVEIDIGLDSFGDSGTFYGEDDEYHAQEEEDVATPTFNRYSHGSGRSFGSSSEDHTAEINSHYSTFSFTGQFNDSSSSSHSGHSRRQKQIQAYFDRFTAAAPQRVCSPGGDVENDSTGGYYYDSNLAPAASYNNNNNKSLNNHSSPFPVSTATLLKKRLNLIPGVKVPQQDAAK